MILLLPSLLALALAAPDASDWSPAVERDGVRVESRPVAGSAVREVRACAVLPLPAERLFAILEDVEQQAGRIPPTVEARLLHKEGPDAWYYVVVDPPAVSRRDYCIHTSAVATPDGGFRTDFAATSEHCPPPRPGLVRIAETRGSWTLTPRAGGATEVRYQGHTDPGGGLPAWLVNRATPGSIVDAVLALFKAAASRPASPPSRR